MRRALGVLLAAACAEPTPAPLSLSTEGSELSIADGLRLSLPSGRAVNLPLAEIEVGLVDRLDDALSYDPYWTMIEGAFRADPPAGLRFRPATGLTAERTERGLRVALSHSASLESTLEVEVAGPSRYRARLTPRPNGPRVAWIRIALAVDEAEAFYGLGEWPDDVNHRGKLRPMQIEADLGIESANNENHAPIPLLIGTSGFGLFVRSERVGVFDVAKIRPDRVIVTFASEELDFELYAAEHPLDITKRYYDATGYPKLPAPWALGPMIWRDESEDQAEVEADIETIRRLDLATTAMWIDRPYASGVNTFDFEPSDYPDPRAMIAKAHAHGLRMGLWHTPYLATDAEPLRSEARQKRYFPPKTGLLLNGWSEPMDFTNLEATAWWQMLIRRYTEMGIEGFKLDYGEDLAPGIGGARNVYEFHDGRDERTMHYAYTRLYHDTYAATLGDGFLLCRAARWGDQKNPIIMWPGDLDANFARHREMFTSRGGDLVTGVGGLPAALIMGLTLGPSGFPFYGSDTGGYRHSPPDEETFIRWVQQTALSTVMQVGDSSSQPPWVYTRENGRSDSTLDIYRRYARLHLRLWPYLWSYAKRLEVDGRAIQRSTGLAHPELGVHPSDTYLLGDHLFVAPVIERGARERRMRTPPGRWWHWWRAEWHAGEITIPAPLEELPLFLREGGIVPMLRSTIDTLSPALVPDVDSFASDPGPLTVRIAPGPASSFELWDGTRIRQSPGLVELSAGAVFTKGYVLELVGPERSVTIDDRPAMARAEAGFITIEIPAGVTRVRY